MENIDSELLLNYYFKDGYMFSLPSRLCWDKMKSDPDIVDVEDLEIGDEKVENEN